MEILSTVIEDKLLILLRLGRLGLSPGRTVHDPGDHGGERVNQGAEGAEGMLLHMASPNESTWLPAGEKPSKRISACPTQELHRLRVSQNCRRVPEEVMRHGNCSVPAHGRWDFLRIPDMRDFTAAHSDGRGFVFFNNRH